MTIKRFLGLTYAVFLVAVIALIVLTGLLISNQRRLTESQEVRFQSFLAADELRQSSDDLTRFARAYVATGDARYEQYYWEILAIRNGTKPRPQNYNRIYWDFVAAGERPKGAMLPADPLEQRMRRLGFTEGELADLRTAQANSDALVSIENIAMHAVKGLYQDASGGFTRHAKPDRALAVRLMNDEAYNGAKAQIMRPIDHFLASLDARTAAAAEHYARLSHLYLWSAAGMLIALLGLTMATSIVVRRRVAGPIALLQRQTEGVAADLDELANVAAAIADGDLERSFSAQTRPLNSDSRDEIGQLAAKQDHMIPRLQEAGKAISTVTTGLSEHAAELAAANQELVRLSLAVEQSPACVVITDLDGTITYVNPKFTEVTGYAVEEAVGQNPRILQSGLTPPEIYADMWQTIRTGRKWRGEWCNKRKNGELYWESALIAPVTDASGVVRQFLGIKEDITERREMERTLRESGEQYRLLAENVDDIIWIVDMSGTFTYVSPSAERMLGIPQSEIVGHSFD